MKIYKSICENTFVKSEAYWINPYGDILAVDSKHIDEILKNPKAYGLSLDEIKELYAAEKEELGSEGQAREKIIKKLILEGWIRLRYYHRNDMWTANVSRLAKKQKDLLYRWAKQMLSHGSSKFSELKIDLPTGVIASSIGAVASDALYNESQKRGKRHQLRAVKKF